MDVDELKRLINLKKDELSGLEHQLKLLEEQQCNGAKNTQNVSSALTNQEILRYSRQLILPEIGVEGQLKLKNAAVLVVGCGGLGCPAAIYLAGAGIGTLGLCDYDEVEITNLHRQIMHGHDTINMKKCTSLAQACKRLNADINIREHCTLLTSSDALKIIEQYDLVVDGTDNIATRYLLNDACVLLGRPLVSGSVLKFDGQLTVYNYKNSPCYRCLNPTPPSPHLVVNCSDGGVLGPVVGVIGVLQAIEAIKILVGLSPSYAQKLLLFDALEGLMKTIKLRNRKRDCQVCGDDPVVQELIDYEIFCGTSADDKEKPIDLLKSEERISVHEYKRMLDENVEHLLVDVREPVELGICKLPKDALNLRMSKVGSSEAKDLIKKLLQDATHSRVVVLCRRGNDSQVAVQKLKNSLDDLQLKVQDIVGGLHAWSKHVDHDFPIY